MEAELVGPVTILAHAELLGQASCWGRRRGAPGDARSETATGRDAIDKRSLQTRSHAECTRGLLPSRRPPEAADYLNLPLRWPAVADVKRLIVRQQAARAGRVEDGGVLRQARVLEVHRCRSV